jgi:hypothetical protein
MACSSSNGVSPSADAATPVEAGKDGGGPTDPIPTTALKWVWVPFPGAKCRDGSTAGILVDANPASDNLMIYLQGGGSCWNTAECSSNPPAFAAPSGAPSSTLPVTNSSGLLDRTNPANPVKDWNVVFVPYCTGDLHAGNNPGFDPGIGPQQFVGYTNMEKFLARIVPTFPKVKKVLHTGSSAGGYGALFTVDLVEMAFPGTVDITLIDDSGPSASTSFLPACVQHEKWTTWGFDKTFLKACGADCPNPDDYLIEYPKHVAKTYSTLRYGLIESIADATIRSKWGYTASDCNMNVTQAPAPMDPTLFQAALLDFRAQMASLVPDGGTPSFGSCYPQGSQHVWLSNADFYTTNAGGVNLIDWVSNILMGGAPSDIGP